MAQGPLPPTMQITIECFRIVNINYDRLFVMQQPKVGRKVDNWPSYTDRIWSYCFHFLTYIIWEFSYAKYTPEQLSF